MGFCLKGLDQFKGADFLEIATSSRPGHLDTKGQILNHSSVFYEHQFYDRELKLFSTAFDKRVLELKTSHDLVGYFQSEDYFFGNLEKLKSYIQVNQKILQSHSIPNNICLINLRGGEYKRFKNLILPKEYWECAIKNMKIHYGVDKFAVVTDDHRYAKALFPSLEIIGDRVADCYASLCNAKYVIASNTSFSYFPLKTNSNSPIVIAPQCWSRFNNPCGRWASPANLYRNWLWQDITGCLKSYDECLPIVKKTIDYYETNYYVSSSVGAITKGGVIAKFLPYRARLLIKSALSVIFPTRIG